MTVTAMMRIDEKVCFISMYQNVQKGDVARKRISAFTADFKNQYFARKPVLRTD
jgi:hypothetical protein